MKHVSFKKYSTRQLMLPMDISTLIDENSVARVVDQLVDQIPMDHFLKHYSEVGRSSYHPKMMVKILIYAYTQKIYSGREIARQLSVNLPLMWLSAFQKPDFRTINRFRSNELKDLVNDIFKQTINLLVEEGYVNLEDYFLDGTKLEANANKYTFVWKKAAQKFKSKMEANVDKLIKHIDQVVDEEQTAANDEAATPVITPEKIQKKIDEWEKKLEENPKDKEVKKAVKKMKEDYLPRCLKYEEQLKICGNRNSYSKTDNDATFMRMEEDHMKNGQLKPGYNIQMGSNDQYVLGFSVHQRPGDTRCLIPHLEEIKANFGISPTTVIADAAYGSEENYVYMQENEIHALAKYSMYEQEKRRKFKKNPHHQKNWIYDQEHDVFICAAGKQLIFVNERISHTESGFETKTRVYKCYECEGCPFRSECSKSADGRSTQFNSRYDELKKAAKKNLETEDGAKRYSKRKIDIESVFGQIKGNKAFRQFSLRGLCKVRIEVGLLSIAHNLMKTISRGKIATPNYI